MKKVIFTLAIYIFCQIPNVKAQLQPGECGIMFTYDATGSLIQREFICNTSGSVMNRTIKNQNMGKDSIEINNKNELPNEEIIKVNAIMPNPNSGKFTINLSTSLKNATVILSDMNGKVIEKNKRSGSILTFNISSQASGMYLIQIESEGKAFTFKVIKQ